MSDNPEAGEVIGPGGVIPGPMAPSKKKKKKYSVLSADSPPAPTPGNRMQYNPAWVQRKAQEYAPAPSRRVQYDQPLVQRKASKYADPTTAAPVGGPGAPGGGVNVRDSEELFPIQDPGKALRNYLRDSGQMGNVFNPAFNRWQQRTSAALHPGFLSYALGQGAPPTGTMSDMFKKYIGEYIGGGQRPGMAQIQQNVGGMNALIRDLQRRVAGAGVEDISEVPGIDPFTAAIGGQVMTPEDQTRFFLGSYLPMLGVGMSEGLGKIVGSQQQYYDDWLSSLIATQPGDERFRTLLDVLTGSMGI